MTRCSTPDCPAAGFYQDQDGDWRCGPHMPRGPLSPAERRAIEEGFDEWHSLTLAERERWAYATIVRLLDATAGA